MITDCQVPEAIFPNNHEAVT